MTDRRAHNEYYKLMKTNRHIVVKRKQTESIGNGYNWANRSNVAGDRLVVQIEYHVHMIRKTVVLRV